MVCSYALLPLLLRHIIFCTAVENKRNLFVYKHTVWGSCTITYSHYLVNGPSGSSPVCADIEMRQNMQFIKALCSYLTKLEACMMYARAFQSHSIVACIKLSAVPRVD